MEIHLEHEIALKEIGIPQSDYPFDIKQNINSLKAMLKKYVIGKQDEDIDAEAVIKIEAKSAEIADDMQTYSERELLETPEDTNIKTETMLTGKDLERAEAVGLTTNNTLAEVAEQEEIIATAAAGAEALRARAIAVSLSEDATEEEVIAAETEKANNEAAANAEAIEALRLRAVAAGCPESATEDEIIAAEAAKIDAENEAARQAEQAAQNAKAAAREKSAADELEDWL